jgi:hypothetical protein
MADIPTSVIGGAGGHKDAEDDLKYLRQETGQEDAKGRSEKPEAESISEDEEETEQTEELEVDKEEGEEESEEETSKEESEEKEEETEDEEEPIGSLVTAKDLKEKYPDIFKKVPELKAVIYREQQYSQLFADPREAQEAATLAETFREIEGDVTAGNVEPLFTAVKKTNGVDFNKFAANVLPSLRKIDEQAFMKVIAVPFKQMLRTAYRAGRSKGNANLTNAAQHIHDFIFDNIDLDEKTDYEQPEAQANPDELKYKQKLQELDSRDHRNFKVSVDQEWIDGIAKDFSEGLDPKGEMTKWVKDKMIEDAIKEVNKQLTIDGRHQKSMEVLWRQAKASGYSAEAKARIVSAALARAKQLIPNVRMKLRREAFARGSRVDGNSGSSSGAKEKPTFRPSTSSSTGNSKPRQRSNPKSTADMSELDVIRS